MIQPPINIKIKRDSPLAGALATSIRRKDEFRKSISTMTKEQFEKAIKLRSKYATIWYQPIPETARASEVADRVDYAGDIDADKTAAAVKVFRDSLNEIFKTAQDAFDREVEAL